MFFVVTGIQFWFTDYMITVMRMNKVTVFYLFATVSITGPVFGIILGGQVTKILGGYNSLRNLYVMMAMTFFTCLVGLPIGFLHHE